MPHCVMHLAFVPQGFTGMAENFFAAPFKISPVRDYLSVACCTVPHGPTHHLPAGTTGDDTMPLRRLLGRMYP